MSRLKLLVIDDEPDVVSLLKDWLEEDGYEVDATTDPAEGLKLFFHNRPALAVVDLIMPGMDGFTLISRIREMSDVRIVVLTALESEEHVVQGLGIGADDYMVKPVSKRVFLARVRSLLRRAPPVGDVPSGYSDASLKLNFLTREVEVRGEPVSLRPTEFRLLEYMCLNRDRVLSHTELLDRVWGSQAGSLDSLKWYIYSLREKLEADPRSPQLIVTLQAVGYRYVPP